MLTILSALSLSGETLRVAVLRVAFDTDASPATTGDGQFVLEDTSDIVCDDWTLDPPPHNRSYFKDHIISADNYWQRVSNGVVSIDTLNSHVYPMIDTQVYQLPHDMLYYHPYLETFDETEKLFELSRDAIALADPDIDFSLYTTIILAHAGMGGDFAFALDPTPGNIPSAYLSSPDFVDYGVLSTDEGDLADLIIIPESQNFLQFKETRSLFADAEDPCFYQVALNGTLALMLGFHLGMPPLYNTETGLSLVGGFALMDQGSNNFHGVVPAFPDPYSRVKMGWVEPATKHVGDHVQVSMDDPPVKIDITDNEYYLIENRQRDMLHPTDMTLWIDEPGFDTVSVLLSEGGVVLQVDEQHAGLPGNGIHIWHVDESAWHTNDNPNGGIIQLVDFVEADGAQDMGHTTQLLFADYLETGWGFDPWFVGNEGWFHLNRYEEIIGDSLLNFSTTTFPATKSNLGVPSHLRIENISKNGSVMSFTISSDRLVVNDSISSFIGWGDQNTLWALNSDSTQILQGTLEAQDLTTTPNLSVDPSVIFDGSDYEFQYRDGWIAPKLPTGVRLHSINSGYTVEHPTLDSLFEFAVYSRDYKFFAKRGSEYVHISWRPNYGQTIITALPGEPLSRFLAQTGYEVIYGQAGLQVYPVGVHHRDYDIDDPVRDGYDVVSWSSGASKLRIKHLSDGAERFLDVHEPLYTIPLDVDDDGIYEIALFYPNKILIINQAGIAIGGNPFSVEAFYGNPIIGTLMDDQLVIFLRHEQSYSIITLDGTTVEKGVLVDAWIGIENTLRITNGSAYVMTGNQLLHFYNDNTRQYVYWSDPQGNALGDRVSTMTGTPDETSFPLKTGSVYNYPNPVKGNTTTIRAWLGNVDTWSIEIFSLNGAQVAYVELDVQQRNTHNEWLWDAAAVSNGVYLAQVIADGKSEIIKIAVIR